jgi:hypothetical protein
MHACPRRPRRWTIDSVMRCRCASNLKTRCSTTRQYSMLAHHHRNGPAVFVFLHPTVFYARTPPSQWPSCIRKSQCMRTHHTQTLLACQLTFNPTPSRGIRNFCTVHDQVSRWVGAEVRGLHTGRVRVILNNINRCVLPWQHAFTCLRLRPV